MMAWNLHHKNITGLCVRRKRLLSNVFSVNYIIMIMEFIFDKKAG
jgi:hypothetical protein